MMICLKSLNPSFWCFLLHWCLIVFFCSWDMFILFNRPNLCDSISIGCNFAWRKQSDYLDEFFTTPHSKLVIFSPLLMRARVRMPWSILLFFLSLVVWNVCLSMNYSKQTLTLTIDVLDFKFNFLMDYIRNTKQGRFAKTWR